jgi:alkyldihydroxyacetonephosphate synthase
MTRARSFWAWGHEDRFPSEEARDKLRARLETVLGSPIEKKPLPAFDATKVRPPRRDAPPEVSGFCVQDARVRAEHTYGKSYPDLVRAFRGEFSGAPDFVLFPETEQHVAAALAACTREKIAVIPFGGGTSVVGGVETDVGNGFTAVASLDMTKLDKVLEIDEMSRAARIQAGASGPRIEEQLHEKGLTLRHFPQSFEHSTLGGWIATRAGGHFATGPTRIDDFVESVRMVTPKGVMETRRLPASGAGPSPERMVLGSEGTLGVITEAWMRLQARPRWRAFASVHFKKFDDGVLATRKIAQSGLYPSNCRLLDSKEAMMHEVSDDGSHVLLIAFESSDHPVEPWMERALSIATDIGGGDCPEEPTYVTSGDKMGEEADAQVWKRAFFEAPYLQSAMVSLGVVADTFETAITWDKFDAFYKHISARVEESMKVAGGGGVLTSRFSHVYPDGAAPYFTFVSKAPAGKELEVWRAVKEAASQAVVEGGGTITHHHAVGRIHRAQYEKERAQLFGSALAAVKAELDPGGILNPGALLPAK